MNKTPAPTSRNLHVKVKSARGRSAGSTAWLQRQLNDPYVQRAKQEGYRSRAAYKLLEIDAKYRLLKAGQIVVDLGAAPGGWTQVAVAKVGERGKVIALDLQPMQPIEGAEFLQGDFLEDETYAALMRICEGKKVNVVISDLAAAACGHPQTDHLRIVALVEAAVTFAMATLAPGGIFLAKMLQGSDEQALILEMRKRFATIRYCKPPASRADSAETYILATGFA